MPCLYLPVSRNPLREVFADDLFDQLDRQVPVTFPKLRALCLLCFGVRFPVRLRIVVALLSSSVSWTGDFDIANGLPGSPSNSLRRCPCWWQPKGSPPRPRALSCRTASILALEAYPVPRSSLSRHPALRCRPYQDVRTSRGRACLGRKSFVSRVLGRRGCYRVWYAHIWHKVSTCPRCAIC